MMKLLAAAAICLMSATAYAGSLPSPFEPPPFSAPPLYGAEQRLPQFNPAPPITNLAPLYTDGPRIDYQGHGEYVIRNNPLGPGTNFCPYAGGRC